MSFNEGGNRGHFFFFLILVAKQIVGCLLSSYRSSQVCPSLKSQSRGPTVQLWCVYTAVRKSSWILEEACALLKDSVVLLLPHPGTSREVPVWHGRKCMLHPGDDRASVPAVVARWPLPSPRETLLCILCRIYSICSRP